MSDHYLTAETHVETLRSRPSSNCMSGVAERLDGMANRPLTSIAAPIGIAHIAAAPGGTAALHRRIHELRSMGLHFAARAIEKEMADLGIGQSVPRWLGK